MSLLGLTGLTIAFLAPLPPERPEPPAPLPGNAWAAGLIIGSVCLIMVLPMVTIWSFHRPEENFRRQCTAAGGQFAFTAAAGDGYRCLRPTGPLRPAGALR